VLGKRRDPTSATVFLERNASFVETAVRQLIADGHYEYENDKGGQLGFWLRSSPEPYLRMSSRGTLKSGRARQRRVRQRASTGVIQALDQRELEPPYSALSSSLAKGFVELQNRTGWRQIKRPAYRGPVEIWARGSERFTAHAALVETTQVALRPRSDRPLYGDVWWHGNLAESPREQLLELVGQECELRFPNGQVGGVLMEDAADGRIRGSNMFPF